MFFQKTLSPAMKSPGVLVPEEENFEQQIMEAPVHSNYSNHQSKQGKRNLIIYAVKHVSDEIRSNSKKKNTPKMELRCENCERDGGNLT